MNEEIKNVVPEEQQTPATEQIGEVPTPETTESATEEEKKSIFDEVIDFSEKSLKELVDLFEKLLGEESQQTVYKNAEAIKAAFYKVLKKEKVASGYVDPALEGHTAQDAVEAVPENAGEAQEEISNNPFADIEKAFKSVYSRYKTIRADYIQKSEKQKEENYAAKQEVIDRIKELLDKQEDVNRTFPEFRALQAQWRSIGSVPQGKAEAIYETYQHCVEMFYDYVKINKELRDLDFKKNLDAKLELCRKAEALSDEGNVVEAFRTLQKLHDEWKEFGPVDRENRESIWERFKAATTVINRKYQAYFDGKKEEQKENLVKKTALCEKVEAIAESEIPDSTRWNALSKEIESIQAEWKKIGFASKKDNQKIYDRFRAACDRFFARKRDFYVDFKSQMQDNLDRKIALCEQAEALKDSTEWKKVTDELIELQNKWKEIGPVSRKKSEAVWKRFRAACDEFFASKDRHFGGKDEEFRNNLAAKLALVEEIKACENPDEESMKDFQERWASIGFVPFKEKEKVQTAYREAMSEKFGQALYEERRSARRPAGRGRQDRPERQDRGPRGEMDRLMQLFSRKQQEISTYENNMGFFSKSKNAEAFLADINKKIEEAKAELLEIEEKIKNLESQIEA